MGVQRAWLATPYVLGGNTKAGVDCSAFTPAVFKQLGTDLLRTAPQQFSL